MPDQEAGRNQLAVPTVLVIALSVVIWLTAFALVDEDRESNLRDAALASHAEGEISGIEAATIAVDLARNAVENSSADDDGLLAGAPADISVRYEPLGTASSWTTVIRGPIRSRPNTEEEFRIDDGMIVIELSARTGEISGAFSAGRAFSAPGDSGGGVLRSLGISPEGFTEVPLSEVWSPPSM